MDLQFIHALTYLEPLFLGYTSKSILDFTNYLKLLNVQTKSTHYAKTCTYNKKKNPSTLQLTKE